MPSCLPQSKHVHLTQACYPKSKTATAKPNSSELQYLAYYASSRPKKLIKAELIISLNICITLVEKCHANLNLFAADLVSIIQSSLDTKDVTVIEHAEDCFTVFCRFHDGAALGSDSDYTEAYERLLHNFAGIASMPREADDDNSQRIAGIVALRSACCSVALQAPNMKNQISILMTGILINLMLIKEEALYGLRTQVEKHAFDTVPAVSLGGFTSSTTMPESGPAFERVQICSLSALKKLFESSDALQVRYATVEILQISYTYQRLTTGWSSTILQIAAEWAPIDLRFHVLGACLEQLEYCEIQNWPTARQQQLLSISKQLLESRINLVGLSTSNVLDSLLAITSSLLRASDPVKLEPLERHFGSGTGKLPSEPRALYIEELIQAVVAIASHSYYKDQVADMLANLLCRIQQEEGDFISTMFNLFLIHAASRLLASLESDRINVDVRSSLSLSVFVPSLAVLHTGPYSVRQAYIDLLNNYFVTVSKHPSSVARQLETPRNQGLQAFQAAFYKAFGEQTYTEQENGALCELFRNLCGCLPQAEALTFLPLVYRLARLSATGMSFEMSSVPTNSLPLNNCSRKVLLEIAKCCGDDQFVAEIRALQTLPTLDQVLDRLARSSKLVLPDDKRTDILRMSGSNTAYCEPETTPLPKSSSRSRLVSSAHTSREDFEQLNTVSREKPTTGRIEGLKDLLLLPPGKTVVAPQRVPPTTGVSHLFDGIELQEWSNMVVTANISSSFEPQAFIRPAPIHEPVPLSIPVERASVDLSKLGPPIA